ncbi:hypothetical protein [Variovorax ginsengisoli]|uniref:Uncharacterized protein n=1 Tax=Variovorax ginsengisoli TaxID=363844 RepID=A0ABT8SFT6_9BURK|nr:hypothetical protein [Variovorax ginsengisoli]MDN8617176.1 hypothetical protein [Variovorax ginsengisoli]MDO1536346.1 hypothetical protein [Variovorax ginsengisoli]
MASILPLPPAIAHGLPWRMVFPTKRAPELLERFAYPDFVASLTPDEIQYCETVVSALLATMLANQKVPKTLARAHVNRATSEILWEERSPAGLKVSLGSTRYPLVQALVWIGSSVSRLVKALRPDPGTRQPEYQKQFTDSDWVDIGVDGQPTAGPRGPKPGSAPVRRPAKLNLVPPASSAERRKRQDESFRLRSKSGHVINGNDHRLGWLLYEAHKVVSLNRPELLDADHVIGKLSRSIIPGAAELATVFQAQLDAVEAMEVTYEIRWVLRELLANTTAPEPWTEESLFWAFGVSEDGKFDPHFWSAAAPPSTFRLRRKLVTITGPFLAATFYSPALAEMADHLTSLGFIGARHLQTRLAPVIGDSNIIGVAKFMTDVVQVKMGRMDNVPVVVDGHNYDLFYWNQDVKTMTVLDVCELALDLTAARGAFRFEYIADAFGDRHDGLRKEILLREILNEWSAVRWLDEPGYGVVIGASPIVGVVEHMLATAWPRSLSVENIAQGLRALRAPPREIQSARERLEEPVSGFVEDEVLLEALVASGRMRRVGRASVALKHKPEAEYWQHWRPVERDLIDYLRSVGGSAPNRAIYQHFNADKSVEPHALAEAMKALPYLHAPKFQWTALWSWAT